MEGMTLLPEPKYPCPRCGKERSIRFYRQSPTEYFIWPKLPNIYFGMPMGVCPHCHKGHQRGPRKCMPGKVYAVTDVDDPAGTQVWFPESRPDIFGR